MHVRGIRGAITVAANTERAILDATRGLLTGMVRSNDVETDEIAAVVFTTTPDLNAAFPAEAARQLGWQNVALMSGVEMNVPGALARCIRVLLHFYTAKPARELKHMYLRAAANLRPDR